MKAIDDSQLEKVSVALQRKIMGPAAFSQTVFVENECRALSGTSVKEKCELHTVRSTVLTKQILWFRKQ